MPTNYAIKNGRTVMDATTYTGNGSSLTVSNVDSGTAGFKPDLVWIKSRSAATDNNLLDSVRTANNILVSNSTAAEVNYGAAQLTFNTNGFTVGGLTEMNANAATFVGWQWQAGQGTTSSNTSGSITSTVSVNATAGFSVITLTTQSSGTGTFGHGLGVAPSFFVTKSRTDSGGYWVVYHKSLGATGFLSLQTTDAFNVNSTIWNNTAPTSSVITLGTSYATSESTVVYCWSEIAGFSQFGSYTGNGSADGPFIYLGFRPKFVLIKRTDAGSAQRWQIWDTERNSSNLSNLALFPNSSEVEGTDYYIDILSNGFKLRETGNNDNASGGTYIYAAFAENPFKYANAR